MAFNFSKRKQAHASDREDSARILNDYTPFAVREAYRTLCTNTLYLPIADKCRKIAVTSAFPGEGKTFISINLGITLASSAMNRKVLIIDVDMRKSRVMRLLKNNKYSSFNGLSEYLAGIDSVPNVIHTDYENLDVIPSGAEAANPTGLINSPKMRELVSWAEQQYDYILFDTPPVNVVSDSLLLNDYINGYFLAARADYSDINGLSQAIDALKKIEANVFGVVLSSVDVKKSRGYYRSYNKYGYNSYANNEEKSEQN